MGCDTPALFAHFIAFRWLRVNQRAGRPVNDIARQRSLLRTIPLWPSLYNSRLFSRHTASLFLLTRFVRAVRISNVEFAH